MFRFPLTILLGVLSFTGCGATKSRIATEQLLVSDAVDIAVSHIDFSRMSGLTVFLDTKYIRNVKGTGFVNADYIISSLRQQMFAAGCRLVDNHEAAEIIAEARIGTLGTDGHEVSFGIPASSTFANAATLVPGAPIIPAIPEISFARREGQVGAVKIAVFAYDRETGHPVWQSGIARARSNSMDFWILGAGPFQNGSIHEGMQFAGERLVLPVLGSGRTAQMRSTVAFERPYVFPIHEPKKQEVIQASYLEATPPAGNNTEYRPIQVGGGGTINMPLEADLKRRFDATP